MEISLEGFHQHRLLDKLVQDAVEEHLVGELVVLLGKAGAQGDHVTESDVGSLDGRHHRVGRESVPAAPYIARIEVRGADLRPF